SLVALRAPRLVVDEAALDGIGEGRAGQGECVPQRSHSGTATARRTSWTASRMVVTTINPPKPVVALSLNTGCPPDGSNVSALASLMRSSRPSRHGNVLQMSAFWG